MNEAEFIASAIEKDGDEVVESKHQSTEVEQKLEEVELSPIEQKAYDQGWRPREQFSGPEENWKDAKEYIKDGEFIVKINELNRKLEQQKAEFDQRLENTNKLQEARRKSEIEDLKRAQRAAVDVGDGEAYDQAQKKIDSLQEAAAKPTAKPDIHPEIAAWEEKNPWINNDSDEKTATAKALWTSYTQLNPDASIKSALDHVDGKIKALYPTQEPANPRREQPVTNETSTRRTKPSGRELSMSDLTSDERRDWDSFGSSMFKDEKTFLKAVADARKK